jgi:hypothetical protein
MYRLFYESISKSKQMQISENLIEPLFERTDAYLKTTIELTKLKAISKVISLTTSGIIMFCVWIAGLFFLLILSLGMALYLGDLLGKLHYGFFIIAVFYLLLGLLMHFFLHKWMQKLVSKYIISQWFQ